MPMTVCGCAVFGACCGYGSACGKEGWGGLLSDEGPAGNDSCAGGTGGYGFIGGDWAQRLLIEENKLFYYKVWFYSIREFRAICSLSRPAELKFNCCTHRSSIKCVLLIPDMSGLIWNDLMGEITDKQLLWSFLGSTGLPRAPILK